jgi:hypothetical protein
VAVAAAAGAVGFVLALRRSGGPVPQVYLDNIWLALLLPAVGLLLVGRVPYRLIGGLFAVGGLGAGLAAFGFAFAAWAVNRPGLYGWAGAGIWIGRWVWMAGLLAPLAVLLLPDGRAKGWRRGAFVGVGGGSASWRCSRRCRGRRAPTRPRATPWRGPIHWRSEGWSGWPGRCC